MSTIWENIVNHVGKIYGHDISIESQNKKRIDIPQPERTQQVKDKHLKRVEQFKDHHSRPMQAREVKLQLLEAEVQIKEDPEAPVKLAILINEIDEVTYQATVKTAIKLDENEKTQYENEWRTHCERVSRLEKKGGQ